MNRCILSVETIPINACQLTKTSIAAEAASLFTDSMDRRLKAIEKRLERVEKKHEKEMKTVNERIQKLVAHTF